jgi:hypothetical protein
LKNALIFLIGIGVRGKDAAPQSQAFRQAGQNHTLAAAGR